MIATTPPTITSRLRACASAGRLLASFVGVVFVVGVVTESRPKGQTDNPAVVAEIREAFAAAYNLDYGPAMDHAKRAVVLGPSSSRAHRGLASILWLKMLFDRGAVSIDHYLGSLSKSQANLPKPDPALAERSEERRVGKECRSRWEPYH